MILTKLSATNFMKFRELELSDLPGSGLVGVLGENESGKSTLGHAICFALFGRTARPGAENLSSLIRWGADFAEVELCFEIPGRGSFRIFREIDRLGLHLAQLEDLDGRRAVCGTYPVARELAQLLGYSYADFRASVYLAQGELDLPRGRDDLAAAIDRLSGVALFRRAMTLSAARTSELVAVRTEVEDALARGRGSAGRVPRGQAEEASHLASIADRDAELALARGRLAEHEARVARVREMRAHRDELARGLDRLAALAAARSAAAEIAPLAAQISAALAALPVARAGAAARAMTAREKQERSTSFQDALERFSERVTARRTDLNRMLDPGRTGSVADERLCAAAEAAHLVTRGRLTLGLAVGSLVLGVLGVILTGVELPYLHVPPLLAGMAGYLPDYIPYVDGLLVVTGLLLIPLGIWQRHHGRKAAARRRREIREIDERIDLLESERQMLAQYSPLELLVHQPFSVVDDYGLREFAARVTAEHADDIARESAAAESTAGAAPNTADEIVREEGKLRQLGSLAGRLQRDLETLASFDEILRRLGVGVAAAGTAAAGPRAVHECDAAALADRLAAFETKLTAVLGRLGCEPAVAGPPADVSAVAAEILGEDSLGEAPLSFGERVAALERLGGEMAADPVMRLRLAELESHAGALDSGANSNGESAEGALAAERLAAAVAGIIAALPAAEQLATLVHEAVSERDAATRRIAALTAEIETGRADFARRETEFAAERRASAETDELAVQHAELDADLAREKLAVQLLDGAAQQLSARAVPHLARAIGRALDRITAGRYSRAEIASGAQVRVYSDEKNAFVDPIELSTGTQAQIHLAERLGFAEVLLLAKGLRGGHFLFLDEPLGGFDRERAAGFIGLLREFTPVFPQIFFLAGDLKLAPVLDRVVRMDGAARELRFHGRMEVLVREPEPQA